MRVRNLVFWGLVALVLAAQQAVAKDTITLVAAGDVEWSGARVALDTSMVLYDNGGKSMLKGGWQPIPRYFSAEKFPQYVKEGNQLLAQYIGKMEREYGAKMSDISTVYKDQTLYQFDYDTREEWARHPFEKIASLFSSADIAFINLETPLSDDAYRMGVFRTPTFFTEGMKYAGVDVAALANNHMLDAERAGLFDTMAALDAAGIAHVGAGENLAAARRAAVIESHGIKVAFLGYTQYENSGADSFANPSRAGVAPLDPELIKADILEAKKIADHVVLSFHWDIYHFDISKQQQLHRGAVKFARGIIDAGADVILGHGPHLPRAVEVYKGKPVFYSMGHLIFSINLPHWMDNFVPRVEFSKNAIVSVEIIPVAGTGRGLGQPYPLSGNRARAALNNLNDLSGELGTHIAIRGNRGFLSSR